MRSIPHLNTYSTTTSCVKEHISSFNSLSVENLSEENFYEWFRGLVDGEGCFMIVHSSNKSFVFRFDIYMHKDDTNMLKYIAHRLGVGRVYEGDHFSSYIVSSRTDLIKIWNIFDNNPLNTTKNLNYILFKEAFELYTKRGTSGVTAELTQTLLELKAQMNKKRVNFEQPAGHYIKITPYWLLGLIEGEGYFSIATKDYRTMFGLGLTAVESQVLEGIKKYLMELPGKYKITRKDTNIVSVMVDSKAKDTNSKPMAKLSSYKTDYLSNVFVPFLDSLTWLSKKSLDYEDWKLVLEIKNQGKHFTDEGKEVILLIVNRMNNNRLSTNKISKGEIKYVANLDQRILNLLSTPSNYELQADGKILIKSTGTYLKGRGNISVIAIDEKGDVQHNFGSIKNCALFFKVDSRTIIRRLDKGSIFEYNGENLVLKRDVSDLKLG